MSTVQSDRAYSVHFDEKLYGRIPFASAIDVKVTEESRIREFVNNEYKLHRNGAQSRPGRRSTIQNTIRATLSSLTMTQFGPIVAYTSTKASETVMSRKRISPPKFAPCFKYEGRAHDAKRIE